MKITIDVDCTPQEARSFLGLPDMDPFNEAMMKEIQGRLSHFVAAMDPEAFMKAWFPGGSAGWEKMGEAFWSQFAGGKPGAKGSGR